MGPSLGCLGVVAAVLAAALQWEIPARADPAAVSLPARAPVKKKPSVKNIKIKVVRVTAPDGDNSNSSYAALGLRAVPAPPGFSTSCSRAGWRLRGAWRETLALKHRAWNSILGRVS